MSKFKTGDKVRIVKASYDWYWYADCIGDLYTIKAQCISGKDASYYVDERAEHTVSEKDIELELVAQEPFTTVDAVLHLQAMLDFSGDAQIVVTETQIFVNAFDKCFLVDTPLNLDTIINAVGCLANQELS